MKWSESQTKQADQRTSNSSRQPKAYPTTKLINAVRIAQEPAPFPPTASQPNKQFPIEWRIIYAATIGWWVALQWGTIAMVLDACHIPAGQTMMSKLPAIFCLQRG